MLDVAENTGIELTATCALLPAAAVRPKLPGVRPGTRASELIDPSVKSADGFLDLARRFHPELPPFGGGPDALAAVLRRAATTASAAAESADGPGARIAGSVAHADRRLGDQRTAASRQR